MLAVVARWLSKGLRRKRTAPLRAARSATSYRPRLEQLEDRFAPALLVWDGGGDNAFWNNRLNWVGDVAPKAGDTLVFGTAATDKVAYNNYAVGTSFAGIRFDDTGYTLSGNRLTLTGGITASTGDNFIDLPIAVAASRSVAVGVGAQLHIGGIVSGVGGMNKTGDGTLYFDGAAGKANVNTGATVVSGGTLALNRALGNAVVGPLMVNAGTALYQANNQIGNATAVTVNGAGLLDLNDHTDVTGKLTLGGGAVHTGAGVLTLGNHVAVTAATRPATISGSLNLGAANRTFTVAANAKLIVSAVIGGPRSLTKAGAGVLDLRAANTYTAGTVIAAGTLLVNNVEGSATGTGAVSLRGGTLGGNGHISGRLALANKPKLSPGMSPGLLSTARVALVAGSDFVAQLYGTTPGMGGYDQLEVTESVSLGGARLVVNRNFASTQGQRFTIIDNVSNTAVVGTFAGLREGATLTVAGAVFQISYRGGDGNDVELTQLNDAPPPPALSGNLDPAFDGDGFVSPPIEVRAAALQADGKIVVAGQFGPFPYAGIFGLARFKADGSLDTTFGNNGVVTTDFDPVDRGVGNAFGTNFANAVHVLPDGKILAVGYVDLGSNQICLARYNANGSLDATFGGDGMIVTSLTVNNTIFDALVQPDGKIVVVGGFDHTGPYPGLSGVGRFNADGTPDTSFGSGGLTALDLDPGFETFYAGALQPDGKIVAVGTAGYGKVIVRFNADGTLDRTFNQTGIRYEAFTAEGQVGGAFGDGWGRVHFDLIRYNPNGAPDPTFGNAGKVVLDVPGTDSSANALTLDAVGKIVVAGVYGGVGSILTRVEPDGLLETSFGNGGTVVAATHDDVQEVLVDAQGRIIVVSKGNVARYVGTPEPPPHEVPPPPVVNDPAALVLGSSVPAETESALPVEVRATFSKAVAGFTAADIAVTNGAISDFLKIDASHYSFKVAPTAVGLVSVHVGDGAAYDADGQGNLASNIVSYTYRLIPPSVELSSSVPAQQELPLPIDVQAAFSEAVTGFTAADISVARGTVSDFVQLDASHYSFKVTPNVSGQVSIWVGAGAAQDADGQGSLASNTISFLYSPVLPTVVLALDGPAETESPLPVRGTVTFSEAVTGFTASDISATRGTVGDFVQVDASHYTFQVTPTSPGIVTLRVLSGAAQDADGLNSQASNTVSYRYVLVVPTVVISLDGPAETDSPLPVHATVTFSEAVTGFDAADLVAGNGTIGNFQAVDAQHFTFDITPAAAGRVTVNLAAGAAFDLDGHANVAAAEASYRYYVGVPTATISPVTPAVRNTPVDSITITFSEAVQGMTLGSLALRRNGGNNLLTAAQSIATSDQIQYTLSGLSGLTGAAGTYTLEVLPGTDAGGRWIRVFAAATSAVAPAPARITDLDGNPMLAIANTTWVVDTTSPTATIARSSGEVGRVSVLISFSEAVTELTANDLTFSSYATIASFTTVAPNKYQVELTWNDSFPTVTVGLAAGVVHDIASNGNLAASQEISAADAPPGWWEYIFIPW